MKKLLLLLIVVAAVNLPVKGHDPENVSIYLFGGGSRWNMKWESWDKFAVSYNQGWNSHISQPLGSFKPFMGYFGGVGFRMFIFGGEYSRYSYSSQTMPLVFKNGDRQEFDLIHRGYNLNFPIVLPLGTWGIGIDMTAKSLNGELHSRTVYADGTVSYGAEHTINGIFGFNRNWLLVMGPRIEFGNRIRGFVTATWAIFDSGDVTGLQDKGSDYGTVWSYQMKTVYLPESWSMRKDDNFYFVGNDPLKRDLKGLNIQAGIALTIFNKNMFR